MNRTPPEPRRLRPPRPRHVRVRGDGGEGVEGLGELTADVVGKVPRVGARVRDELVGLVERLGHVERVLVLHQGRKIADGTPSEVVRNAEVVEAYLGDEMVEA